MTYQDGTEALNQLQTFLIEQFEKTVYKANLEEFGGVDIVLKTTETTDEEQVGRPTIVLQIETDEVSKWSGAKSDSFDLSIKTECKATDFCGAMVGVTNLEPSQVILSRSLSLIFRMEYKSLNELGLEISSYRQTEQVFDEQNKIVKGKINFTYWNS